MRCFNSVLEDTRIPRKSVRVILEKNDSMRFSQDPCLGVKMNSNRFGTVARYVLVSLEICAE